MQKKIDSLAQKFFIFLFAMAAHFDDACRYTLDDVFTLYHHLEIVVCQEGYEKIEHTHNGRHVAFINTDTTKTLCPLPHYAQCIRYQCDGPNCRILGREGFPIPPKEIAALLKYVIKVMVGFASIFHLFTTDGAIIYHTNQRICFFRRDGSIDNDGLVITPGKVYSVIDISKFVPRCKVFN